MDYGYIRPIEINDTVDEQKKKIENIYENIDIKIEKHHQSKNRIELNLLINETLKSGDTLYVTDFFILADSITQLAELIKYSAEHKITIININKSLTINENHLNTFDQFLDYIIDFQKNLMRFKTKYGLNEAVQNGKILGRPRRTDENMQRAIEMYLSKKYTLEQIKTETNISRATLYRHLDH